MNELLEEISGTIREYKSLDDKLDFQQCETLVNLMKDLSSNLFFLETHLNDARQEYYGTIVKLLKNHSATEAEKRAKDLHPDKRMLEQLTRSAGKVLESIRSHLSYLKNEKTH
jgi:hypothetical protein